MEVALRAQHDSLSSRNALLDVCPLAGKFDALHVQHTAKESRSMDYLIGVLTASVKKTARVTHSFDRLGAGIHRKNLRGYQN